MATRWHLSPVADFRGGRPTTRDAREERLERARDHLGPLAWLLDSSIRIPGTNFRFGLEPIIGLLPGAGDLASGALGFYLIARALQFRLPWIVVARMIANTLLDLAIGSIPVLGDVFDFAYKSNTRNMRLFHEYATDPGRSTRGQWAFFLVLAGVFVAALLLVAAGVAWVVNELAASL